MYPTLFINPKTDRSVEVNNVNSPIILEDFEFAPLMEYIRDHDYVCGVKTNDMTLFNEIYLHRQNCEDIDFVNKLYRLKFIYLKNNCDKIFSENFANIKKALKIIHENDDPTANTTNFIELDIDLKHKEDFLLLQDSIEELKIDRMVISTETKTNISIVNEIIDKCIEHNIWTITRNIPFCLTSIEHVSEIYDYIKVKHESREECPNCIFSEECSYIQSPMRGAEIHSYKNYADFKEAFYMK